MAQHGIALQRPASGPGLTGDVVSQPFLVGLVRRGVRCLRLLPLKRKGRRYRMLESAAPSIVKSVRQRDMLNTWLRLFGDAKQLPAIEQFQFDRIEDERPDLVYFEVEYETSEPRFKVVYEGRRLTEAFGKSGEGKYLEEVLGPKLANLMAPLYYQCLARGRPVYSIFTIPDASAREVAYERLLLPFGTGTHVDAMIASIKTISVEGSFEQRELMRNADATLAFSVQAVIDGNLEASRIAEQLDADIIEI